MKQPLSDPALEALLKNRSEPQIADDGFTTRVMSSLPSATQPMVTVAPSKSRGTLLVWIGAAIGLLLALRNSPSEQSAHAAALSLRPEVTALAEFLSSQTVWIGLSIVSVTLATLYFLDTRQSEE